MLNPWPALWILLAGPLWGLPGPDRVPPRGPFSPAPPCCSAAAGREAAHPGTTLLKEKRIDGKLVREHTHLADGLVVGTYELGMFLSPARALAATCGLELPDPLGGAARGGRGRIKSASAALQRFRVSVAAASRQIGEDMWAFARCKVQRGCFPAGTPARTERGLVPVEEVRKGGKVHSWDPATGEWRLAEVEATMSREYHGDIITVTVTNEDGEAEDTFRATANHPVFVAEGRNLRLRPQPAEVPASEPASEAGRWVSAGDLRIGDTLLTERHSLVPITELTRERRRIPVYNLHVRGAHTYTVGQSGALVHNSCAPISGVRSGVGTTLRGQLDEIHRLAPDAQVGYRGSLARGTKGPHKGNAPFDPNDFDVDAFIVSDTLAAQFPKSAWFRSGDAISGLADVQKALKASLRKQFPGMRDEFTFRIYTQDEFLKKVASDAHTLIK